MAKAEVNFSTCYSEESFLEKVQKERDKKLNELWSGVNYIKYMDIIERRIELLNDLHKIYPDLELQSEALQGWRTKLYPFDEFDYYAELRAPAVHYRILPNEIVFEIDGDNLDEARKEAKRITKELLLLGAKPFVGFSGNRGYHIHLLVAPPDGDVFNFAIAMGCREFTLTLFEILKDLIKPKYLDEGVMSSKHHTIRAFYSLNMKTKKWKVPVFGRQYSVWVLPKRWWERVFEELKNNIEVEEVIKKLEEFDKPRVRKAPSKKYKWIERVLENPDKITDGRARLLWLAIVPYLILQGYSDEKVTELCQKWVEKSGVEWTSKYRCKVSSMIKHCRDYERKTGQKWMPISLNKLVGLFPDLKYLKEVIS